MRMYFKLVKLVVSFYLLSSILTVVVLLIISGSFSAAETAISAFSASMIHKLKTKGDKRAIIVDRFVDKRQKLISSMLVGNTVVNVVCTSVSTVFFIDMMGKDGLLISSVVMTLLILFFAEVLPKSYSVQEPDKSVLKYSKFILITEIVLKPITFVIDGIAAFVFKIFNVSTQNVLSASDVMRDMIALHANQGTMSKDDLSMLESILDLADTEISKVMTPRLSVVSLNVDMPKEEFIRCVLTSVHSRIPVWKGESENIVGIIHVKDLVEELNKINNDAEKLDLYNVMMRPWFVPESTLLSMQLHSFKKAKKHFALVIDEYGIIQGVVTLEDILEEIVGNISDEHDLPEESSVEKISEEIYHIDAFASIRDVNRYLDWDLPEEAPTIAGLLIKNFERIPEEEEELLIEGFKFKILEKKHNTINKVEVSFDGSF